MTLLDFSVKSTGESGAPNSREIELDFLRGLAILIVIDYHSAGHSILFAPFLWLGFSNFGWIGVDIFFVLSGFLIGGLLLKEWKLKGPIASRRFLIRRGFKIWPQYYVFLLAVALSGHRSLHQLWGNLLNIQNYVGGIPHTWTLAVEEHAYLLLVLVLAIASRRQVHIRKVFWFVTALALAALINGYILNFRGIYFFYRTDTRIDGILYGVLLAILFHHAPARFDGLQALRPLWFAILAATLVFLRFMSDTWWARSTSCLLANLSGIACLMLLYRRPGNPSRLSASWPYRLVAAMGVYSYGIYLWHVSVNAPILSAARHLPASTAPAFTALAPFVCAILVGIFFTRLVEFPFLALRDRLYPRTVDSAVDPPALLEPTPEPTPDPHWQSPTNSAARS